MSPLASLNNLGWQPFFTGQLDPQELQEWELNKLVVARVCAHYGGQVAMLTPKGEYCVPTALLESTDGRSPSQIAVGDWLLLDAEDHRARRCLERKTVLARKAAGERDDAQLIAANVDTFFIVSSCNQEFSLSRLERYLALVIESGANVVIVLTKADLCDDPATLRRQVENLRSGLLVETLDARDIRQTDVLDSWCGTSQTISLLGSSGVGKSTLASTLGGHKIPTQTIREDDAKGRHTTTARSMYQLRAGGWLIDNPGMRELQLTACEHGLADVFEDVLQLAENCRYRNCNHRGDVGCALQAAVAAGQLEERRLASYLKLQAEQARNAASLAERRERDRKFGKMCKSVMAGKKRLRET